MAAERPEAQLGELVQNFDSRRVPLSSRERETRRGTFPYYGATGVLDHVDDFLFEGLHLLVAEDGSVERPDGTPFLQLVDGKFWVNNHAHVLKGATDEDTRFLFYALSTVDVRPYVSGSVQAKLSQGNLNRISTAYPPDRADRRAIAHILGTLDDKIELNRRMGETLEAMARALFKSWFVDFDPVRAKAEGRDPGLPKPIADLFPSRLVCYGQSVVPADWSAKPLREWVEVLSGGTPSKSIREHWDGDIPWISPKVMTGIHADEAEAHVTAAAVGSGTRIAPAFSTLVMVRGMGLHQFVRVSQARRDVAFNQDIKALVGSGLDSTLLFFALLCAQAKLLEHVESSGHGTGVLPTAALLALPITMPDPNKQRHLAQPFRTVGDRIACCHNDARVLTALRDTLLPILVSGERRVMSAADPIARAVI